MKHYTDAGLKRRRKDELIDMIRCLENNVASYEEMNSRQFNMLMENSFYEYHDLNRNPNDLPEMHKRIIFCVRVTDNKSMYYTGEYDGKRFVNDDHGGVYTRHEYEEVRGWAHIKEFGKG